MSENKNPQALINIAKAHLPKEKKYWYAADQLLKSIVDAYESLLKVNKDLQQSNELLNTQITELQRKLNVYRIRRT